VLRLGHRGEKWIEMMRESKKDQGVSLEVEILGASS
jgi:hypothetical protein